MIYHNDFVYTQIETRKQTYESIPYMSMIQTWHVYIIYINMHTLYVYDTCTHINISKYMQ